MNFKVREKRNAAAIIAAVIVIIIILGGIIFADNLNSSYKYKEEYISFESLIDDAYEIKDFEAHNGRIKSLSDDPWISYRNFSADAVMCININVNYLSDNYTGSEIFIMYEDGGLRRYGVNLSLGENIIRLNGNHYGIQTIRFDLLMGENQEIGVSGVLLNDSDVVTEGLKDEKSYIYVFLIEKTALLFPLAVSVAAIVLIIKIRNDKKGFKCQIYAFGCICIAFIIYVCFVISGTSGIYKYKNMSFDEFTNNGGSLKEFNLSGNNTIISETGDPWINYYDNRANAIKTITLNIDSLSLDPVASQLFIFYEGTSIFDIVEYDMTAGENNIVMPNSNKKIDYLRFDIVSKRDVEIGINSVEINKPNVLENVLKHNMVELSSKLSVWCLFIAVPVIMVLIGRKYLHIYNNMVNKSGSLIAAVLIFAMLMAGFYGGVLSIFMAGVLAVFIGSCSSLNFKDTFFNKGLCCCLLLTALLSMYALVPEAEISKMLFNMESTYKIKYLLLLMCEFVIINTIALLLCPGREGSSNKISVKKIFMWTADAVIIILMVIAIETLARVYLYDSAIRIEVFNVIGAKNFCINILLYGLVFVFLKKITGDFLGYFFNIVFYLFIFIGNFVKLKFHDTVFKPMDILQIKDFISIVTLYVKPVLFYGAIFIGIVLIIYIIYRKRAYILKFKPNIWIAAISLFLILYLSDMIYANKFEDIGISSTQLWEGTEVCVDAQGLICYTYIELAELSKIYPRADENYSKEYMKQLKSDFDNLKDNEVSDIKPNVILVMEESMFDVQKVPNVDFSMNLTANMNKYKVTDVISPKYGGGTASVEFEALTGLSNYFFLDNIVPYVTYWSNTEKKIPGLAEEFNANDYNTVAIHPNKGNIYNRDIVYECMGFDKFLEKSDMDFSDENTTDDLYFKDDALADVIDNELTNAGNVPSFVFAVTIENHTLYKNKYSETEVKLSSEALNDEELNELEQYSEGVFNADRFIQKMIDIVDNADRPTILYIWGDHLPSLSAFSTLGFINDVYNKYTTPLIAYSNYKDITIDEEYITPNQIAPQILRDAEIDYSSYFDFIYSLREKYPVIQKEFGIDQNDEMIKKYEEVQYDLLFGEQYLIEGE